MTRLMPRCEGHKFPILECSDCAPTPDDLLDIAHDEPPPTVAVTVGAVAATLASVAASIGTAVAIKWAAGVVTDALRGGRRP